MDAGFLLISKWSIGKKIEFLLCKYLEIFLLMTRIHKFKLGESFVYLFGKKIYYDSPYGIAGYESKLSRDQKMIINSNIRNVKTFVDVGANVGFYSMTARELFPNVTVYAVEPVPQIFECLKKNLTNRSDNNFNLAISDKNGKERMIFHENESAFSRIANASETKDKENIINVKARTLDKFCAANKIKKIDFLKIDTESFELNVLKGARDTLGKTRYLHIEISIERNSNYTFTQLNSLLYSNVFNFQLISFRNFTDKGDGPIPVGDFLYKNIMIEA